MTTQYTPGPWTLTEKKNARFEVRTDEKHSYAFNITDGANAKLIAAAPDMLAALQSLLEWANWACGCSGNDECAGCYDDMALQHARAAINKAIAP